MNKIRKELIERLRKERDKEEEDVVNMKEWKIIQIEEIKGKLVTTIIELDEPEITTIIVSIEEEIERVKSEEEKRLINLVCKLDS